MKDDSEIPDLLPKGGARQEQAGPREARQGQARPQQEKPAPSAGVALSLEPAPRIEQADPDDLEFDLTSARGTDLPWDSPLRRLEDQTDDEPPALQSAAQPSSSEVPVLLQPARPTPSQAPAASVQPVRGASMRPVPPAIDLGLESTVWDLDDDLVDPAAAQLNVAVPMKEKDDVPWPHGRTPAGQELDVPGSEVERALGLSPASGWLTAPLYFWSARGALRRLRGEATDAEVRLEEAEAARDRLLGELAGALRSKLDGSDRFRAPYDRIDQHVRIAAEARSSVAHADTQSESGLSQVDVELESAKATVTLRTRDAAERRALAEGGQRDLARLRAAHQRHLIERRNVVSRAQETAGPGSEMPPELAGRFLAVEEQIKRAEAELGTLTETQKQLDTRLRAAEDEERQALAHVRRIEGKREGLILAHQGTLGDLNDTLRTAEQGLARALADVGLAIVELHGEVPVDEGVRRQLLECDKSVLARALELERLRRAAESVDVEAYQRGRMVLIGALALSVLLVGWLAVA